MDELANNSADSRIEGGSQSFMLDVQDNPENYIVEATLPGVNRDQIDVELNEGRLNITVDKQDSEEVTKRNYIHRETTSYHAVRSVFLKDADTTGLSAQLKDGILTVNVPKRTQNTNVCKIEIA
ncbi:MAG: Hsp20 family protein [Coriobacteriales bacterium]|nr:Hsp20 family protein [Coriobacteriales bacterium]